jgi:hypothetical protein
MKCVNDLSGIDGVKDGRRGQKRNERLLWAVDVAEQEDSRKL